MKIRESKLIFNIFYDMFFNGCHTIKYNIFIDVRQLIKKILREETQRNLSFNIEELLQPTVDKYGDFVCGVRVSQDVMNPKKYSLTVIFVGGSGSKNWPMTQAIHGSHGKVMKEMWETIYNYTGIGVELDASTVRECDKGLFESLEDIQGTPLYHHTSESRALSIMNSDMLRGTRPDDDILAVDPTLDNTPHQSMVSLTRDKNFVPNETIGASAGGLGDSKKLKVIFVVDKDKLKSNYKIVPFDYSALEDRWYDKRMKDEPDTIMQPRAIRTSKSNEYEERVLTNKIQPLRRYVTDIIYKGDNPLVQEKIDEFLGRRKQEQNESELTERCWKGYTQKGMKTMFGKRYPNCVKAKK